MAEKKIKSVRISGKEYALVSDRLKYFRESEAFVGWSLITKVHECNAQTCVMEAQIINPDGRIIATGFAREERDNPLSKVNKTSHVENCETSAWGRALANLGIGIDAAICSAEELVFALAQQTKSQQNAPKQPASTIAQPKADNASDAKKTVQEPTPEREQMLRELYNGLTDREREEYDAICANLDAAENVEKLRQICKMYTDANCYALVVAHANTIAQAKKWGEYAKTA